MYTKKIQIGAITYSSKKQAWQAACKIAEKKGVKAPSYMTFYMRLRAKKLTPSKAMVKPVRKYEKKIKEENISEEILPPITVFEEAA